MKKFNIRKVLDGLTASSSSAPAQPGTPRENDGVPETLQSEHFQLCKVGPGQVTAERTGTSRLFSSGPETSKLHQQHSAASTSVLLLFVIPLNNKHLAEINLLVSFSQMMIII